MSPNSCPHVALDHVKLSHLLILLLTHLCLTLILMSRALFTLSEVLSHLLILFSLMSHSHPHVTLSQFTLSQVLTFNNKLPLLMLSCHTLMSCGYIMISCHSLRLCTHVLVSCHAFMSYSLKSYSLLCRYPSGIRYQSHVSLYYDRFSHVTLLSHARSCLPLLDLCLIRSCLTFMLCCHALPTHVTLSSSCLAILCLSIVLI